MVALGASWGSSAVLGPCFVVDLFSDARGNFAGSDERGSVSRRLSVLASIERLRLLSLERE